MRLRYVALLLAATFVLASAGTAFGGPSLRKIVRDISALKSRTNALAENDRTLLERIQLTSLTTSVVSAPMTLATNVGGFYRGSVSCPSGTDLVSGGPGWNGSYYVEWTVSYSHPDPGGTAWEAAVYTGSDRPASTPVVYAVCGKAN